MFAGGLPPRRRAVGSRPQNTMPSKGKNMKTMLPVAVTALFLAAMAEGQELPKVKIAVVRINSVMSGGNLYDRIRLLSCDKETLAAIKKLNADLKAVEKEVIDAEDDVKLNDLGRKVQFLNQKLNLLRQRAMSGNPNVDMQAMIRNFVVSNFKDKYHLILQQDSGIPDRFILWKGNADTDDITDEVSEKFRQHIDQTLGE
jgi:hypothetical protein